LFVPASHTYLKLKEKEIEGSLKGKS